MKLSIIIPVHNEKATIKEILRRIRAVDIQFEREIIIVDDCSTDGTRGILKEEEERGVRVFFHEQNMGKGAAIKTGLEYVAGDYVLIQDGDLEYDPKDYPVLLEPILAGKARVVYGSRFLEHRKVMSFWNTIANKFLTLVTNILYSSALTDVETCYKVFPAELARRLELRAQKFDFEPEITAKILKGGYHICEVPISYTGRGKHEGKKISWKDGITALFTLIKYRFVD